MISDIAFDPTAPFQSEVVNLEGTDYLLSIDYNQREDCYYMTVSTPDGDDIVVGIKLVANWPLLHKWADERLPPGEIFVYANTSRTDPAPGLGQIGDSLPFTLCYATSDEFYLGGLVP